LFAAGIAGALAMFVLSFGLFGLLVVAHVVH
jgi:hypothetical protein